MIRFRTVQATRAADALFSDNSEQVAGPVWTIGRNPEKRT